jgi:hypothetical protein
VLGASVAAGFVALRDEDVSACRDRVSGAVDRLNLTDGNGPRIPRATDPRSGISKREKYDRYALLEDDLEILG